MIKMFHFVNVFCKFLNETEFIPIYEFSHFNPSDSLLPSHCGGVIKWLCGAELPAGVKPQPAFNYSGNRQTTFFSFIIIQQPLLFHKWFSC